MEKAPLWSVGLTATGKSSPWKQKDPSLIFSIFNESHMQALISHFIIVAVYTVIWFIYCESKVKVCTHIHVISESCIMFR